MACRRSAVMGIKSPAPALLRRRRRPESRCRPFGMQRIGGNARLRRRLPNSETAIQDSCRCCFRRHVHSISSPPLFGDLSSTSATLVGGLSDFDGLVGRDLALCGDRGGGGSPDAGGFIGKGMAPPLRPATVCLECRVAVSRLPRDIDERLRRRLRYMRAY